MRLYRVIYEAIDEVKKAMARLLEPEYEIPGPGLSQGYSRCNVDIVAGCYVNEGKFLRNAEMRYYATGLSSMKASCPR